MEITCDSCNRTFALDAAQAKKHRVARCLCGARLSFVPEDETVQTGPQHLGKYLLVQRIAVGGMGEIFYGKIAGVEGFEREVAIKKMLPHLSEDRAFIDMMIKEAKLTVLLHHPNIVQVYDLAKEGKEYYIAMEYVPGVTVGHMLELSHRTKTHLPYQAAVHITMQVLRGLAYAHDLRGPDGEPMHVLHRDITPQNILVTRNAWVKITDFGIAKARNEISTTSPGMIKGKLGYIAPEQLTGQMPDQRIDIFCAGILLWESLATRRLFKGTDEIDTFRMISEARVPPLSSVRDDVPEEVEKALLGALTRTPEERYANADAFYDALNQAIFPHTPDEYANVAKQFFETNPEYFESVAKLTEQDGSSDGLTVEMSASQAGEVEPLTEISELLHKPAVTKPSSKGPWIAAAAIPILLAIIGFTLHASGLLTSLIGGNPPRKGDPPAVSKTKLTQEEIQLAVDGESSRLVACYTTGKMCKLSELTANLVIASTGGLARVELQPSKLGRASPCIREVLLALRFRPHDDPSFETTVQLPLPKSTPICKSARPPPNKPLTNAEIKTTIQAKYAAFAQCIAGLGDTNNVPSKVNATVTIATSAKITKVKLEPTIKPAFEQCMRRAFLAIRFKHAPVKEVQVTIPLTIQKQI